MIGLLRGVVAGREDGSLLLDVHGVGWLVACAARDLDTMEQGATLTLLIHTIVREDAIALYGFLTAPAKDLFVALLTVSGLGPKGAMALLSEHEPAALARAIHDGDVRALCRAKGVGKRTAELIVVNLRERIPAAYAVAAVGAPSRASVPRTTVTTDVASALANLGFRPADADTAIAGALAERADASESFDLLLRLSLARLRRDGKGAR